MKEAFWGVLIVLLGLFGIVVVNLFQNVTIDNDRVYYLIKESTEASAYDALDLTYYRLNGNFRIVTDKFAENLTRRFAQNITAGDYTIIIEDINEVPPKVSLRIRSGVTSLKGEEFSILNRVDGIIETKYSLNEVLDFLCEGKTEEECNEIKTRLGLKVEIDTSGEEAKCRTDILDQEMSCIPGDIKFIGWGDISLPSKICQDETPPKNVERKAIYKMCECGKWSENKEESLIANPVNVRGEFVYTWIFRKSTEVKTIEEISTARIQRVQCTESIGIQVPENYKKLKPGVSSSTTYVNCPSEGIRIPEDTKVSIRGSYNPINSINREIIWTTNNTKVSLKYDGRLYAKSNPNMNTCELNSTNTNCYSTNILTAKKEGKSIVTATNLRRENQKATCEINVWDGTVDTISCNNLKVKYGEPKNVTVNYTPENASKIQFTYSLADTSLATINENGLITAYENKNGNTKVIVNAPGGKSTTCNLEVWDGIEYATSVSCNSLSLDVAGVDMVTSSYSPTTATMNERIYSISDSDVATIDSNTGLITGVKAGSATITVKMKKNKTEYIQGTCTVTVKGSASTYIPIPNPNPRTCPTIKFNDTVDYTWACSDLKYIWQDQNGNACTPEIGDSSTIVTSTCMKVDCQNSSNRYNIPIKEEHSYNNGVYETYYPVNGACVDGKKFVIAVERCVYNRYLDLNNSAGSYVFDQYPGYIAC